MITGAYCICSPTLGDVSTANFFGRSSGKPGSGAPKSPRLSAVNVLHSHGQPAPFFETWELTVRLLKRSLGVIYHLSTIFRCIFLCIREIHGSQWQDNSGPVEEQNSSTEIHAEDAVFNKDK